MSPFSKNISYVGNILAISWSNCEQSSFSQSIVWGIPSASYTNFRTYTPESTSSIFVIYQGTGSSTSYNMSDKNNGNYFIVFQSKDIYGKYSKIEDSQRYSNNAPLVYDNSTLLKQVFPYDIYTVSKTNDTIIYNNTINYLAWISYGG